MPFWSSQTLKVKIPAEQLVVPYVEARVVHSAYEMGVGSEAFVTSNSSDKTQIAADTKIVIPPGQFGLLVTRETVRIPANVIAFISIRAGIKFQGLVNVSGFHVDPGYHGQLKFAVYNAGSRTIVLDQDQRVFMIWFADLDKTDENPYPSRQPMQIAITADDVMRIQGDVASPAQLKKQIDELRIDLEKKIHAVEQSKLFNRSVLTFLLGMVASIALAIIGWVLIKPTFDRPPGPGNPPTRSDVTPGQTTKDK
jgi:dCTP deaminase